MNNYRESIDDEIKHIPLHNSYKALIPLDSDILIHETLTIPTYVINLTKDVQKWETSKRNMEDIGIQPKRFNAILGKEVPRKNNPNFTNICLKYSEDATIGIASSHMKLWEKVIEDNLECMLILEDDVFTISNNDSKGNLDNLYIRNYLKSALTELPSDFDMLYLGHFGISGNSEEAGNFLNSILSSNKVMNKGKYSIYSQHLITPVLPLGLHAYIISNSCCRKLLAADNTIYNAPCLGKIWTHIDLNINNIFWKESNKYNIYATRKKIIHQSSILADSITSKNGYPYTINHILKIFENSDILDQPVIRNSVNFSLYSIYNFKLTSLLTAFFFAIGIIIGYLLSDYNISFTLLLFGMFNTLEFLYSIKKQVFIDMLCSGIIFMTGVSIGRWCCSSGRNS